MQSSALMIQIVIASSPFSLTLYHTALRVFSSSQPFSSPGNHWVSMLGRAKEPMSLSRT